MQPSDTEVYALRTTVGSFSSGTEVLIKTFNNLLDQTFDGSMVVVTRHKMQRVQTRTFTEVIDKNGKQFIKQKHHIEKIGKSDHLEFECYEDDLVLLRQRSYSGQMDSEVLQ